MPHLPSLAYSHWAWLLPPLLALVVRGVGRRSSDGPFRWRADGAFGLVLSLVGAFVVCRHLGPIHLVGGAFASTGFGDYCMDVAHAAGWTEHESLVRSRFVATLLGPIAQLVGVRGALAIGAAASTAATLFGLYLWGHALGGRVGAFAAVVFSAGLDPLTILARHLSFYPEMVAVFTVAAGLTTLAARERGRWAVFLPAAIVTGLTPFVDLRGAFWILSLSAALLIISLGTVRSSWPMALLRIGVLGGMLAGSWRLGADAMPGTGNTVEATLRSVAVTTLARPAGMKELREMDAWCPTPTPGFKWGSGDLGQLRSAVTCSARLVDMAKSVGTAREVDARVVDAWVVDWLPLCLGSGLVLLGLRRREPVVLLVAAITIAPFASGWGVFAWMETDLRRVFTLLPPIAALLGGAFGALAGVEHEPRPGRWRIAVTLGALGLLVALHSPWVYTWWNPRAQWRPTVTGGGEHATLSSMGGAEAEVCVKVAQIPGEVPALGWAITRAIFGATPSPSPPPETGHP